MNVRALMPLFSLALMGCTTITWTRPGALPDEPPIFEYRSGKDVAAEGFLVEIAYFPDGQVQMIHVEIGRASGEASPVVQAGGAAAGEIVEHAVTGAIKGVKGGVP